MAAIKAKLRWVGRRIMDGINRNGYDRAHRLLTLHGFSYDPETQSYERKGLE